MRSLLLFIVLAVTASNASSTAPLQASLEQLATTADHILVGVVTGVDMIDHKGKPLRRRGARTGPGLRNTIRLIVEVKEIVFTTAVNPPRTIRVPLDPMMHFELGQIRDAHSEPSELFLLFLRGDDFQPILPGVFARPLADRDEAMRLRSRGDR